MDIIVQRYLPHYSNDAHHTNGVWEDVATLTIDPPTAADVKDAARAAVAAELAKYEPLKGTNPDHIRVMKKDHVFEFDAGLGKPVLSDTPTDTKWEGP